jgi:1-acyl-sn-glycerol-3-phosphate acyltransferase
MAARARRPAVGAGRLSVFLRSILFLAVVLVVTPVYALIALMVAPARPQTRYRVITGWTDITMWCVRHLLGIGYQVIGRENVPERASVILSKHQSAWETMALQHIFPPHAYVLKKELLRVPFLGWGLAQMPIISIDRGAGKDALQQVLEQGGRWLEQGFWVVVFPEGTRVAPGTTRRYKPGGAWLASHTGTPVVPVAHNAGEFWRRQAFLKYPGTITVSIGPAIDTRGLSAEEVNSRAQAWIEAEMRRLFPHHYEHADPARPAV